MLLLIAMSPAVVHADSADDLTVLRETTNSLLDLLVEQGLISRQKADALIQQAQQRAEARRKAAPPVAVPDADVVRIPYIPEVVKRDIEEKIKQQVLVQAKTERWGDPGALPAWLDRITWDGDFRLRYQMDRFPDDHVPNVHPAVAQANGIDIDNTSETRHRLRLRFRFGLTAAISDKSTVGLRMSSGTAGDGAETAANQTMGVYGSRFNFGIDRAYFQYKPNNAWVLSAGRIGNPFFAPTDLVWHRELSLDGVTAKYTRGNEGATRTFATAGVFPIQDVAPNPINKANSKWMFGYQAGVSTQLAPDRKFNFAVGFFDYHNTEGTPNPTIVSQEFDATAPAVRQRGNSVFDINGLRNQGNPNPSYLWGLASKFRTLNIGASADVASFDQVHVIVDADYVKNFGFDQAEILNRTGLDISPRTTGYQARLTVGHPQLRNVGAWQAFLGYRYLQRDATLDAFTDSEFALGGTDVKGYFIGGWYAFDRNTQLGLRWMSSRQIDGLPLAIDVLQLDMLTNF
ncbi:MAG: putative porin [Burkholderiales bacterium]|nr:putative porin [Burkholderiales bacterium]